MGYSLAAGRAGRTSQAPIPPATKPQKPIFMNTTLRSKHAFTLIEIMVVVLVIGTLAAIALPAFTKHLRNAHAAAFVSDIRSLSSAGQQYALESGWYLPATNPGEYPTELEGYFSERKFELGSTMGGVWDFEQDGVGDFTSAVGVVNPTQAEELFLLVDKTLDDGNLSTGYFQKFGGNYYFVIEE